MTKTIPVTDDVSPEAATAVIDVLLLAIIRAYPRDGNEWTEYKRLNAAKRALFGIDSQRGAVSHDDTPELLHMAAAYIRERGEAALGDGYELNWPDGDPSVHAAETRLALAALNARKVSDPNYRPHSEDEKIRNLQQKFHGNIGAWLKMAHGQQGMTETVFALKLRELTDLLEPLGVRISTRQELLRDAKGPN